MSKRRRWVALVTAIFAGVTAVAVIGPAPATAAEGGNPTVIGLGDSFASGEGGGWAGNSSGVNANAGNRQGTDLAARQRTNGSWDYVPEQHVYDPDTYRELNGWWGSNACHRSVSAPITWVKDGGANFAKVLNLACSGAKSKNVWLPANGGVEQHKGLGTQLEQLRARISTSDDVKLVVIGVGGNDVEVGDKAGFGAIVAACVSAYVKTYLSDGLYDPRWCQDSFESKVGDAISDVFYNTRRTIDQVRQVLTEKGQALGTYKLVVTGYPSITPTDWSDWSTASETGHWDSRCPIRRFDSAWINRHLVTRLNDMIQAAAQEKSAAFIDMRDAFVGHRLCESGTLRGSSSSQYPQDAEWLRYFDIDTGKNALQLAYWYEVHGDSDEKLSHDFNSQRSIAESFHPNYWGQRALGHCLHAYYTTAGPLNSLHRCHVGGVGPYDHPDYMVVGAKAPLYSMTDDPTPNLPLGSYTTRQITIPASVPAGHYVQWVPDINHARKGQLRIHLTAPDGTTLVLRDFNPNDTGGWANGTFTRDYTADPSGAWTLKVWESDLQTYNGTLNGWSLRLT